LECQCFEVSIASTIHNERYLAYVKAPRGLFMQHAQVREVLERLDSRESQRRLGGRKEGVRQRQVMRRREQCLVFRTKPSMRLS